MAPRRPLLRETGIVAVGGCVGTAARLGIDAALPEPGGLPLGIAVANLTGAFLLGLLLGLLAGRGPDVGRRRDLRLLLGTGVLGGYTTYSALAVGTLDLAAPTDGGSLLLAASYAGGSLVLGLLAAVAGTVLGRRAGAS